ncbi:uncharacterized protein JCM15063_001508 [Sporobolomyces koalae]|uniref:uncharacterized protein n=1 Tax=Sporobolomyces koalae TaxID=500713 RepID=UPI0031704592
MRTRQSPASRTTSDDEMGSQDSLPKNRRKRSRVSDISSNDGSDFDAIESSDCDSFESDRDQDEVDIEQSKKRSAASRKGTKRLRKNGATWHRGNPKNFTSEGQRDYIVLEADAEAKSEVNECRQRLAKLVEHVAKEALDKALTSSTHAHSPSKQALEANRVLNGLHKYVPGAEFNSAQTVATADPNSSTAVSPFGMQVWQGLILALGREEGRGAVPSGLATAAVDLLCNLTHRGGGAESPSGNDLQEAWRLAKAEATRLVNETLLQGSDARRDAIDAIEHQTIEWSGSLFDATAHISNYAPLASLDRADDAEGIDADSTFTGRLMREKGSNVYDMLLINANGFAADPYAPNTITSALVRTTPVELIDREDGGGVELRGRCTRAFWDTAGVAIKTRARGGTIDSLVGPQAYSLGIAAAKANVKEFGYNFIEVGILLELAGYENEYGCYCDLVANLDACVTYSIINNVIEVTNISLRSPMWCAGHVGALYCIARSNLTRAQLVDATEAALHVLKTGRELDTVERSNFAQSAIPRIPRVPHPKSGKDFAISVNQLRRDEKELQASLDPARVPRGGLRCDSFPTWLQQSLQQRLGTAVSDDCDFVKFQDLPLELQEFYAAAASASPTSSNAKARLDGVSPLEACASLMHLKTNATKRQQVFDDGQGGTMNGLESGARKATATRRAQQLDDGQGGMMNGLEAVVATRRAQQLDDGQGGTMNGLQAVSRKAVATRRAQQIDDGQGGTMNGLEAGTKKGIATKLAQQLDDGQGGTMNGLEAGTKKGNATKLAQQLDDGQGGTMNGLQAGAKKANATKLANGTIKMIHQGVKEFKCPECNTLFRTKGNCTQHCINVHHYDKDSARNYVIYEPTNPLEPSHEPTDQPEPADVTAVAASSVTRRVTTE